MPKIHVFDLRRIFQDAGYIWVIFVQDAWQREMLSSMCVSWRCSSLYYSVKLGIFGKTIHVTYSLILLAYIVHGAY